MELVRYFHQRFQTAGGRCERVHRRGLPREPPPVVAGARGAREARGARARAPQRALQAGVRTHNWGVGGGPTRAPLGARCEPLPLERRNRPLRVRRRVEPAGANVPSGARVRCVHGVSNRVNDDHWTVA